MVMFEWLKALFNFLYGKKEYTEETKVFSKTESLIDKSFWRLLSTIEPGNEKEILEVTYLNELGFSSTITCMAIFESDREYKLIAPWIDVGRILQKSNISELGIKKVIKETQI